MKVKFVLGDYIETRGGYVWEVVSFTKSYVAVKRSDGTVAWIPKKDIVRVRKEY